MPRLNTRLEAAGARFLAGVRLAGGGLREIRHTAAATRRPPHSPWCPPRREGREVPGADPGRGRHWARPGQDLLAGPQPCWAKQRGHGFKPLVAHAGTIAGLCGRLVLHPSGRPKDTASLAACSDCPSGSPAKGKCSWTLVEANASLTRAR